jgi:polysaccharide biosynthesis transport protein
MNENNTERELQEMPPPQEIDLREYWDLFWRRRWLVAAVALTVIAAMGAWTFTARPTYTAKGQLLIEKEPNILTFEEIFQIESFRDDYYQTQYKLLQSRALASDVVVRLNLDTNKEFVGNGGKAVKAGLDDPALRQRLTTAVLDRLEVKPVRLTRLVDVSFSARDPKLAAAAVNALFDAFIDMNIRIKYEATEQATEFLTQQIASLGEEIGKKERELQSYGESKNIIALSDTETTIVDKLGELNKALTDAQIDRIRKETYYTEIKNASPDFVPEGLGNPLIQRLREEYVRLSREYSKKAEAFRPEYPEMQRLKAELDSARDLLKNETANLIKAAYSEYQAALGREKSLQEVFDKQREEAFQMNSNAILYNSLKIEVDNKKSMLESLLKRESETGVSARLRGLRTSNVRIIDRADVPLRPSKPRKKTNMIMALLFGLGGGLGLALILERLDNSVKSAQDVERYASLPTLGIVPTFSANHQRSAFAYGERREGKTDSAPEEGVRLIVFKDAKDKDRAKARPGVPPAKSIELICHQAPKSSYAESYRSIRTSLLLSAAAPDLRTILLTSPLPEEGKSVTASNLAVALAQTGKQTLLIDADLRKPRQHRIFRTRNTDGLTNFLTSDVDLKTLVKMTDVANLYLINSGPLPPNPAELLGSSRMRKLIEDMKEHFSYILLDTPPMLTVTDALVVGPAVDGVILLVWGDKTPREALAEARTNLDNTGIKVLGVIINNLDVRKHGYSYRKYHYYHGYYPES